MRSEIVRAVSILGSLAEIARTPQDAIQSGGNTAGVEHEALQVQLYEQIGRLKPELDWLKKSCPLWLAGKSVAKEGLFFVQTRGFTSYEWF